MSSTASAAEHAYRVGFNPVLRGMQVDCDGGGPIAGTHLAGRQSFAGTLTGDYRDFGPYRWRWYLLAKLTRKPATYVHEAVWCEAESLSAAGNDDEQLQQHLYTVG